MTDEEIAEYAQELLAIYDSMSVAEQTEFADDFENVISALNERRALNQNAAANQPPPAGQPPSTTQPQVPEIARELWALSRGDPDVFALYMQSYPNNAVNAIARNPAELNNVMNQINNTQRELPRGNADGIEQAPLQSSNIFGARYDPLKKDLKVRFQNGSVYKYQGVPKVIFDMFITGQGVARTSGSNRWGRWWKNKFPSLGSALHNLIKLGGYPYTRIK